MTDDLTDDEAQRLSAWMDGEASAEAREALERRVQDDPEFSRLAADYSRVDSYVRRTARISAAKDPSAAVVATIRNGFIRRQRRARWRAGRRFAIPIAASIAILIGGGFWIEDRMVDRLVAAQSETTRLVADAMQQALEATQSGHSITIGDDRSVVRGTVTPVRTFRSKTDHWCREFKERLTIGGDTAVRTAVACRVADGVWRRVETRVEGQAPLMFGPMPNRSGAGGHRRL